MSLSDVAEKLGVSKSPRSRVQAGQRGVPDEHLRALALLPDLSDEFLRVAMGRLPENVERRILQQAVQITSRSSTSD